MIFTGAFGPGNPCQRWSLSKRPWYRLLPLGALLVIFIHFTFLSNSERDLDARYSSRNFIKTSGGLVAHAVLNRAHASREAELTGLRQSLEYWWDLKLKQSEGKAEACPLSISGPPKKSKNRRFDFFILQAIEILEAMGFTNITTCQGRYPTYANVTHYEKPSAKWLVPGAPDSSPITHNVVISSPLIFPGRPHDKMAQLLLDTQAARTPSEDLVYRKFCYTPVFRPQRPKRMDDSNTTAKEETEPPKLDPKFCSRLLDLYRAIQAGSEPPLLTLFTWFPDVLDDPIRDLRRLMLVNMDQFRPFVQPVLVSDRRMVMSLANGLSWPCLPVSELSPDGFPVFKAASTDLMKTFNSTFYGYIQRKSVLDASLLETLMAAKEKFVMGGGTRWGSKEGGRDVTSTRREPGILLYGSSMYTKSLSSVRNHHSLGVLAQERKDRDLYKFEPLPAYVIYNNKLNFYDLPPLKIDDKYLIPLLVSRSRSLGHLVINTTGTVLSLYTFNGNTLQVSDWGRKFLVSTNRNDSYNKALSDIYLRSLRKKLPTPAKSPLSTEFDNSGKVLFKQS